MIREDTAARLTDAIVKQSAMLEKNSAALELLEKRLAIQPSAPLFDPRTLVVRAVIVSGVSALVGACTAFAWAGL